MAPASARRGSMRAPRAFQYCKTMEMAADPQPSSLCFTNGTSSHTPAFSWDAGEFDRPRKRSRSKPSTIRFIRVTQDSEIYELTKRNLQDDDADGDQDDPPHIAVRDAPGGEIVLRLARPLGQLGKIFIA